MIRRLTILAPLALAAAFGVRFATAQAPPEGADRPASGTSNPTNPGAGFQALKKGLGGIVGSPGAKTKAGEKPAAKGSSPDDPAPRPFGDEPPLPDPARPLNVAPPESPVASDSTQGPVPDEGEDTNQSGSPFDDLKLNPPPSDTPQVPFDPAATPNPGVETPNAPSLAQPGYDGGAPSPDPSRPLAPPPGPVAEPTDAPGAMPQPDAPPAPGDEGLFLTQNPGEPPPAGGGAALPPAIVRQGGGNVPDNAPAGEPFVLPPDQIKPGPNTIGVTAEVRAPEVANLNNDSTFLIVVKNSGPSDASNVLVRYPYSPEALKFVQSDPATSRNDGGVCYWQFGTLPSGAEKLIRVKVHFLKPEAVDHAATVQFQTAAKARTQVRQPKLKVEIQTDQSSVLKGRRVLYTITVSNFGDLAARGVEVHAKLSPGLGHSKGSDLIYSLKEQEGLESLTPGDTRTVKLELDTKGEGEQTCDVKIVSPDVPAPVPASKSITVVEPALKVALSGHTTRYPDTEATYTLTVTNEGTSPANRVTVGLKIPYPGGQPTEAQPPHREWDATSRTLFWREKEIRPGESREYRVTIRMRDIGRLDLMAGARAEGVSPVLDRLSIDIEGLPDLHCTLSEPRRVIESGEETEYQLRLRNDGTKDATEVRVRAILSEHFEVKAVSGPDGKALDQKPQDGRTAILPQVDRIPAGGDVTLSVRVKAVKEGVGTCTAEVRHKDVPEDAPIVTSIHTRVTTPGGLKK